MLNDSFAQVIEAETSPETPEKSFQTEVNLATVATLTTFQTPNAEKQPIEFTVITSYKPDRMTKIIGIDATGKMTKNTAANMTAGHAKRVSVSGLAELRSALDGLTSAQAVTWGIAKSPDVRLCTTANTAAQGAGALARTRENFRFPSAPGILMLDHDGLLDGELDANGFIARLTAAVPVLAGVPMLWRPSASAGCMRPDGTQLSGLTRHRLYIPVTDASKIPEAGKAIVELCWSAGAGWFEIGKAGQRLSRCLVDAAVWTPEHIDFVGPSILIDGVTRAGVDGIIHGDGNALVDLVQLIDSVTPSLKKQAASSKKAAFAESAPQADAVRQVWVTEQAPQLAQRRGIKLQQAVNVLDRAASHHVLMGDFELQCQDGQTVTVGQILDNSHRWHNTRFADPLDPGKDRRVAVARLLNGQRPDIYSHAHGGQRYELRRQSARVQLGRGMRIDATDSVLAVLRERSELFDFGTNAIAYVADGKATPVSRDWMTDHLGRVAEFYSVKVKRDDDGVVIGTTEVPEDAPTYISSAIIAKNGGRNFRKLTAVCTAPTLRLDGSIIDTPGHDASTGLMYVCNEAYPPAVPYAPTPAQALDALAFLWGPIHLFPFVDGIARGVTLAAMLAACVRPSLPTCPGTGFDAPAAGTGKTLLAKCVGALATGQEVAVLPPTNDEDECRKRLFAALRMGSSVLLWDNVREPLGNSVIDSFLTSGLFADRVLGVSENVELPNRALFIVSGNNLVLTGDTHRRVLMARLDAELESPFKREFDFDPLAAVCAERARLVVAALTIIRAYITAGRPKSAPGRIASFEQWDDLVRQPLCWLKKIAKESGRDDLPTFTDPADAIDSAAAANPETAKLTALLTAWQLAFGTIPTTPKQAITEATATGFPPSGVLWDALDEVAGQNGKLNVRILGRWLERHAGQLCNGLRLELSDTKTNGLKHWIVTQPKPSKNPESDTGKVVRVARVARFTSVENFFSPDVAEFEL